MAIGQALKLEFLVGKSFIIVADGPPVPGEDPLATPNYTENFNHLEPWHRIFTFFSWEAICDKEYLLFGLFLDVS